MQLSLSSDLRYALSQTEILSYLVFGVPTFALGQQGESALRPVAQALLPTLGSALERTISDQIGFIDLVQIQATGLGQEGINNFQTARDYLSGYRIGVGKQLGSRTFVTANAGLCPLAGGTGSNFNLGDILGLTVEHQLGGGLSSQFGVEPAASKLSCNRATRLEINTPKQIHFDLFKEWRF